MVKYQAVSIEVAQVLHDSIKFDTTFSQNWMMETAKFRTALYFRVETCRTCGFTAKP
jgi:hypothetical protein